MNTLSKLSFLTLVLTLGACNEKVSPELQGAASSTTTTSGTTTVVPPDSYYFRVVNSSDTMLNFKVHKTGQGNANTNCEVTSTTALSSDAYRADPVTNDITCYFDAEELSMSFNGFQFSLEASKNTCDYVGYSPYSYYDRRAGTSTQSLIQVTCPEVDGIPDQTQIEAVMPAEYDGLPCDSYRNVSVNPTGAFSLENDADICAFNYTSQGGPNCDTGTVSISGALVTVTDPDGTGPLPSAPVAKAFTKTVNCQGKIANCIDGPIKDEGTLSNSTSGIVVQKATKNTAYTKAYTYAATFETYGSNRRYVNFRRDLAALEIEFGNSNRNRSTTETDLANSYMSSFGDPVHKYDFDPELMTYYSDNKRMDGTTLITTAHQTFAAKLDGLKSAKPISAEPFLGLNGFKTSPFYTMYCFDNAFDVKARIRMVVRDFDRVFSGSATDTSFERVSDVDLLPPLARQDIPYTDEVTGEADSWNSFNDVDDWDDLIDMERDDSGTTYDPSITIWRTFPVSPYTEVGTNGFFNPDFFPNEKP